MIENLAKCIHCVKGGNVLVHSKQDDVHVEEHGTEDSHHVQMGTCQFHNPGEKGEGGGGGRGEGKGKGRRERGGRGVRMNDVQGQI